MADGLFNYQDPRMLQEQYLAQQRQNAMEAAQLPMLQQVIASGGNLGATLGTGLGRLFGGQTAAEVENETIKSIFAGAAQQTTDPVERMRLAAAEFRKRGMEGRALELEKQLTDLQVKQTNMRKTEAEMETKQQGYQFRYQALKARYPEMSDDEARGIAFNEKAFEEVIKVPKVDTQVVETAEGQILINKKTGERIAKIGASPDRRSVTNVSVDTRGASGALGLVKDFDAAVKDPLGAYRDSQTAKVLINESLGSKNSQAWEQARTLLAKATGQGRLSNEDIRRTGVDPRFVQGVADWINKKTTGVPNEDIQRQLYVVAAALERETGNMINQTAQRARSIAEMEGVDPTKLDTFFPTVPVNNSPRRQGAGASQTSRGTKYQIIEE